MLKNSLLIIILIMSSRDSRTSHVSPRQSKKDRRSYKDLLEKAIEAVNDVEVETGTTQENIAPVKTNKRKRSISEAKETEEEN